MSKKPLLALAILALSGPLVDVRKTVTEDTLTDLKTKLELKEPTAGLLAEKKVPLVKLPDSWGDVLLTTQPRIVEALTEKPERLQDLLEALDKKLTPQQLLEQWGLGANTPPSTANSGQKVDAGAEEEPFELPKGYGILVVSSKIAAYGGAYTIDDFQGKPTIDSTPRVLPLTPSVKRWISQNHVEELTEEAYLEHLASQKG